MSEVRRYRTGMASLLAKLVEAVGETERWLDVAVEGVEASSLAVPGDDPSLSFRMMGTALLRKAKYTWSQCSVPTKTATFIRSLFRCGRFSSAPGRLCSSSITSLSSRNAV